MKITQPLPESSQIIGNLDSIKLFTYGLSSFIHSDRKIQPRISSWPQMDFPGLFVIGMPLIMVRAGYCMFWLEFSLVPNFGHYSTGGILYSAIQYRPCWVECSRNIKMICSTDFTIQTETCPCSRENWHLTNEKLYKHSILTSGWWQEFSVGSWIRWSNSVLRAMLKATFTFSIRLHELDKLNLRNISHLKGKL